MFKDIKVIVFDLDGTLYEDTHHFQYYAKRIMNQLPEDKQLLFNNEYENAVAGNHTLKVGRVYDAKLDLVLVQEKNKVLEAFRWDGTSLTNEEVKDLYPNEIVLDLENMFSVGDLWWIPASIARHYGLSGESTYKAFIETREYMMTPDFEMTKVAGFKEALLGLKEAGISLTLLTNSPENDSEVILSKLGLDELFAKKIFEGRKPTLTKDRFEQLKNDFNVDFKQIVSIGDNWINEILPAQELGCKTILIDSYDISDPSFADVVVRSISEVIPLLVKMNK